MEHPDVDNPLHPNSGPGESGPPTDPENVTFAVAPPDQVPGRHAQFDPSQYDPVQHDPQYDAPPQIIFEATPPPVAPEGGWRNQQNASAPGHAEVRRRWGKARVIAGLLTVVVLGLGIGIAAANFMGVDIPMMSSGDSVNIGALQQEVTDAGFGGVQVAAADPGPGVVLTGQVQNLGERQRLLDLVNQTEGAAPIDAQLIVTDLPAAVATVTAQDGGAILTGLVPSEDDRARILEAVQASYPSGDVADNLIVSADTRGMTIRVDGGLTNVAIFKALSRNLAGIGEVDGASLALAAGAEKGLNALFAAQPILFESGTADITESSLPTLDDAADLLTLYPEAKLEVGGHTDTRGPEDFNQDLSVERAEAVLAGLRSRGVPNELVAVGYGETRPLHEDDSTEQQQQENRRIEFRTIQ